MSPEPPLGTMKSSGTKRWLYFMPLNHTIFKKDFLNFIFREGGGREKERERNINVELPLLSTPYWGPGLQPRHAP